MTTSPRIYDFVLPHTISGIQDEIGVNMLKAQGFWGDKDIPAPIRARMEAGEGFFGNGAVLTKADADAVSDRAWAFIATKLGLAWHKPSSPAPAAKA